MINIIVDTNALIDYVNGYAFWIKNILKTYQGSYNLVLPTIVLAEYFTSDVFENVKETEIADRTFALFSKQDLTVEIATFLGKILRRKTYVAGASLANLIIAATTLQLDGFLATRNKRDFAKIPDLRFFDPKQLN